MEVYRKELERLRENDEIQGIEMVQGFPFINTAGHGYLVVDKRNKAGIVELARQICKYGYNGDKAYYLEEDCEAPKFLEKIK